MLILFPRTMATNWTEFKKLLDSMNSKRYAHTVCGLAQDFQQMLGGSLAELDIFSKAKRATMLLNVGC